MGRCKIKKSIEIVEHELKTLNGLTATDGFEAYYSAQGVCDCVGAWDCFVEETFEIDTGKALKELHKIEEELNNAYKSISELEEENGRIISGEREGLLK